MHKRYRVIRQDKNEVIGYLYHSGNVWVFEYPDGKKKFNIIPRIMDGNEYVKLRYEAYCGIDDSEGRKMYQNDEVQNGSAREKYRIHFLADVNTFVLFSPRYGNKRLQPWYEQYLPNLKVVSRLDPIP
ncbi:MAG: hypothetical protein MK081_13895 [Flavobacteriales bacterium]|nr:hypothetical protein [Flavobacteriales bacterium]